MDTSLLRIARRLFTVVAWFVNLKVEASSRSDPAGQLVSTLGVISRIRPGLERLRFAAVPVTVTVTSPPEELVVTVLIIWLPALIVFKGTKLPEYATVAMPSFAVTL